MKKGDTTTIRIDRLGTDGVGTGTIEGRPVKVPGTVPGDIAEIFVTQIKRRSARGRLTALVEQGVERIKPPCPHFSVCGGCRWQDIPYPYQLSMKAAMLIVLYTPIFYTQSGRRGTIQLLNNKLILSHH